jgi:Rod binding domain-containing protein
MNPAQKSIYQDMITNTLADTISHTGEFGLAQAFRQQLMPRNLVEPEAKTKLNVDE